MITLVATVVMLGGVSVYLARAWLRLRALEAEQDEQFNRRLAELDERNRRLYAENQAMREALKEGSPHRSLPVVTLDPPTLPAPRITAQRPTIHWWVLNPAELRAARVNRSLAVISLITSAAVLAAMSSPKKLDDNDP